MAAVTRWRGLLMVAVMILTTVSAANSAVAQPMATDGDGRPPVLTPGASPEQPPVASSDPSTVPPEQLDQVLGSGWRGSGDRAWTTTGDGTGLHVLVADAAEGYAWRTVATLSEPGFEVDQWVGNACVTGSGDRLVVVYAPRTFTNEGTLFERGGFTAVVELSSGAVTKLPVRTSLAYFNPGCGTGETAVLTQGGVEDLGRTRLVELDARDGALASPVEVPGQLTSAVPLGDGMVAADAGSLVRIEPDGTRTLLAEADGVPFALHPDGDGGVVFLDHMGETARVRRATGLMRRGGLVGVTTFASGPLDRVGLTAGAGGRVFLTGDPQRVLRLPGAVRQLQGPKDAQVSTTGAVVLTAVQPAAQDEPAEPTGIRPVHIEARGRTTGREIGFTVRPGSVLPDGGRPAPAVGGGADRADGTAGPREAGAQARTEDVTAQPQAAAVAAGSPNDPVDTDRSCSVPRNDPRTQVYQPKPRQVEWAVDQAVTNSLHVSRPADWKQSGLPAYTPQGLFPSHALEGGGRVPAQIMLGILAQESNLWQASYHALPGVTANPLVGNFYGRPVTNDEADEWDIDWSKADCGYGVAQVTDGMRRAGYEKPGETARSATQQRAIAVDFAANIAAGLQILQDKWNQTRSAGLVVNDGNPAGIENWFFAVWAYNSGFYPDKGDGSPWGVGWLNNPVNPIYPANRSPFLEVSYADAAHPQDWPYPEKVIGWAGHPIESLEAPNVRVAGYRAAWWSFAEDRARAKPPVDLFCDASNQCEPGARHVPGAPDVVGAPAGPCAHRNGAGQYDLRCWYHEPASWKGTCTSAGTCGNELLRFDPGYAYQTDGTSYAPNCSLSGLPPGALVIDDVPDSVPSVRPDCGHPWTNRGTFRLDFAGDGDGTYPSKVDFHQIGGGFGGHFWFAHTRATGGEGNRLKVTGTWTLDQEVNGWARVMVHMPDHGAHTQQASYEVDLGNGQTKTRKLLQRTLEHRWVSLGAFPFSGTPRVRLSTITHDGVGRDDVAWDAIAVQPLPGKPRHQVVALGNSYSSGEGASVAGGGDYYRETDNNGNNEAIRNACHRSRHTWSRQAVLSDAAASIGARADSWDPSMDYHLIACSGAQTEDLLPFHTVPGGQALPQNAFGESGRGRYGEVSQLDKGFLDEHTTLVTLSIGGNDARFADVIVQCVTAVTDICQDTVLPGDSKPMREAVPELIAGPVEDSLVVVLEQIHSRAPNAKILLMGYPALLEGSGSCVPLIGTAEAPWLNEMADLLAEHMAEAAQRAVGQGVPVSFSDPRDEFAGQAVCGDPETIQGVVTDKTPGDDPDLADQPTSAQSFHPKISGAANYADSMNDTARGMGL